MGHLELKLQDEWVAEKRKEYCRDCVGRIVKKGDRILHFYYGSGKMRTTIRRVLDVYHAHIIASKPANAKNNQRMPIVAQNFVVIPEPEDPYVPRQGE